MKKFIPIKYKNSGFSMVELVISASLLLISIAFFSSILPNLKKISESSSLDRVILSAEKIKTEIETYYANPLNWSGGKLANNSRAFIDGNFSVKISTNNVNFNSGLFSGDDTNIIQIRIVIQEFKNGRAMNSYTRTYYVYKALPEKITGVRINQEPVSNNVYLLTAIGTSDTGDVELIPRNWEISQGSGTFEYYNGVSVLFHKQGEVTPKICADIKYNTDTVLKGECEIK